MIRNVGIDNLAGLLILHMIVVVHVATGCGGSSYQFYYIISKVLCFFLPWFFYKSGMYYRSMSTRDLLGSLWRKLGVPYLFFSLMSWFVIEFVWKVLATHEFTFPQLLLYSIKAFVYKGIIPGNAALWFLLDLMIVKLIYHFLRQLKLSDREILIGSSLIYILLRFTPLYHENVTLPLDVMCGLVFYVLGSIVRIRELPSLWMVSAFAVLFAFILFVVPFHSLMDFRAQIVYTRGNLYFALLLAYSVMMIVLSNALFSKYANKKIQPLMFVGQNSLLFFAAHYPLYLITSNILKMKLHVVSFVPLFLLTLVLLSVELGFCYIVLNTKHLKFLIGK